VIGSLGSEPVGGCEALVELAEVGELDKRRQLVDNHLGLGPADGVDHGVPVQRVEDHGRPFRREQADEPVGIPWPTASKNRRANSSRRRREASNRGFLAST
jgi:hypothetical protein